MTELQGEALPQRLDIDVCRSLDRPLLVRADDDDDDAPLGTLAGEFSVFDEWYEIDSWWEGNFLERIAPGSFKRTINNRSGETPVRVLLEHGFDPTVGDKPLGVPSVLEERDSGPYAETPLLDTSYNRDLAPALRAGAYGQSFRFKVLRDEWDEEPGVSDHNPKGIPERTVTEVRLIEFGPTVFPASPATNSTTGLRSSTDSFYEQLARRDSSRYEDAVRRAQTARRAPAKASSAPDAASPAPGAPEATRTTEDPQIGHSDDPAPTAPEAGRRHSEDSPQIPHSTATTSTPSRTKEHPVMETMTIEERAARQSEIRARLAEIDAEYAGSTLPDEARTEFDNLTEEFDRHTEAIEDTHRRQEAIRARAENPGATERVRTHQAPAVHRSRGEDIYDLSAIRQQARSVDEVATLTRDNAMRAVEQARYPGVSDRSAAQTQVERLLNTVDDDQASLARRILVTGSPVYVRAFGKALVSKSTAGLTAEEQRALSLGVDSEGGYAVPFQLDPTVILTSDGVANPLREISRVEQIVGKEWQGVTSAGMTVGRRGEGQEADDDSPSFDQPTVKPTAVDAFVPFSIEIDQDWSRMQSELTMLLRDAKDTEEASSFINGDGTGNNPEGLLTGTTLDVAPAVGGSFSSEDLYNLEEALPERFLANATWLGHRSAFNAARQLGSDSDGGDLWVRLAAGLPPELIGYPARRQSEMPVFNPAAAAGTVQLVLGDFRQFLIVDRVGMNVELVQHLFGPNRRPTGQRGIYAIWRNGCKVLVDNAFRRLVTAAAPPTP